MTKIIDFKPKSPEEENSITERILKCVEKIQTDGKCECKYCNYRKGATKMVFEMLVNDMYQYMQNIPGTQFSGHDAKEIFFDAIKEVVDWEEKGTKTDDAED